MSILRIIKEEINDFDWTNEEPIGISKEDKFIVNVCNPEYTLSDIEWKFIELYGEDSWEFFKVVSVPTEQCVIYVEGRTWSISNNFYYFAWDDCSDYDNSYEKVEVPEFLRMVIEK